VVNLFCGKVGEVGMKEWICGVTERICVVPELSSGEWQFIAKEELVRCKDCKHGEPGACGDGVDCDGVWHEGDWFCADGVRKE